MANALVLFDIDGTLLRRAGPHHRRALEQAVTEVTGAAVTTDGIPTQGMLDRDIVAQMLRQAGVPVRAVRIHMPAIVERAQQIYPGICPDLRDRVCPGAETLLGSLTEAGAVIGLVTGNLTAIGWKKMEHAGLKRFFRFGAFAEMARNRSGLVRIAIRHAKREKWIGRGARISLIGDHQNDVNAARTNAIQAIAVATGNSTAEELAACGPDQVVPDLSHIRIDSLL
jgi:phosphoglycolate phosphatase-like HAD superfamily hydrolase